MNINSAETGTGQCELPAKETKAREPRITPVTIPLHLVGPSEPHRFTPTELMAKKGVLQYNYDTIKSAAKNIIRLSRDLGVPELFSRLQERAEHAEIIILTREECHSLLGIPPTEQKESK